jgi:lauroyl/myristoyl acyltransferase
MRPFPVGPVRIARLAGAPIFPAFCLRQQGREFVATLCDPIEVPSRTDPLEAEHEAMTRLVRVMEDFIGRHLGSWYLFDPVWEPPDLPLLGRWGRAQPFRKGTRAGGLRSAR